MVSYLDSEFEPVSRRMRPGLSGLEATSGLLYNVLMPLIWMNSKEVKTIMEADLRGTSSDSSD